ncbi:MAG: hypothetical protein PHU85_09925 [Phycisphaerae bacterium]|nr:hypothetical protein [Phycisphaerae bacterium]
MNRVVVVAMMAAAVLVGCHKSEPGGQGGNDTFKVVVPAIVASVTQGEVQTVRVSVERGDGFKQGVKLHVKAPAGLQVDPESTTVKAGDKGDVQLKITAAKDAPLGEQTIQVHGTPDKGDATQTEFKITVSAK